MKYFIIILFTFFYFAEVSAQKDTDPSDPVELNLIKDELGLSEIYPPSPDASTFSRYGDYNASNAYGTINLSIPLFNLKSGDLQLPVNLDYNSGGNKVSDRGEYPGLGWSFSVNYIISREVIGKPDEGYRGYFSVNTNNFPDNDIYEYNEDIDAYLRNVISEGIDTKPDIFSYSIPGYSGKFILKKINNRLEAVLIPFQPIEITVDTGLNLFIIKTEDGTRYTFGYPELTSVISNNENHNNFEYRSSWHIMSILSSSNRAFLFEYEDKPSVQNPDYKIETRKFEIINAFPYFKKLSYEYYIDNTTTNELRLKKIRGDFGYLDFDNRNNIIKLVNTENEIISTARLVLSNFDDSSDCFNGLCNRQKLTKVILDEKIWSMEYENIEEPPLTTKDKDKWGYYNGANNNSGIPNISYGSWYFGGDADRETDTLYVKFGMLKKIVYPTGGYSIFTFEANTVDKGNTGNITYPIHDKFIRTLNADGSPEIKILNFEWPFFIPTKGYEVTWSPALKLTLEFGTKLNSSGVPEHYRQLPRLLLSGGRLHVNISYDTAHSYFVDDFSNIAVYSVHQILYPSLADYTDDQIQTAYGDMSISGSSENYIKCILERDGFVEEENDIDHNYYAGGVRIKEIKNYNDKDELISVKRYKYTNPVTDTSSGYFTKGSIEEVVNNHVFMQLFSKSIAPSCVVSECEVRSFPEIIAYDSPLHGLESVSSPVAYEYITEIEENSSYDIIRKEVYEFSRPLGSISGISSEYPSFPFGYNSVNKPVMLLTSFYDDKNNKTREIEYQYSFESVGDFTAFAASRNREFNFPLIACCNGGYMPTLDVYKWKKESFISSWLPKKKEIYTDFFDNDSIVKEISYERKEYFSKFRLINKIKTSGTAIIDTLLEMKRYAPDVLSPEYAVPDNVYENTLLKITGKDSSVISSVITEYDDTFNKPARFFNFEAEKPVPYNLFQPFTYDKGKDENYEDIPSEEIIYTETGNIEIVKKKNDAPVTFIWGDKNKDNIVAYVKNCDDPQKILFSSFEGESFIINPPTKNKNIISGVSRTGNKCYELDNEFSTIKLPEGFYVVEFWALNENNITVNSVKPKIYSPEKDGWKKYETRIYLDENNKGVNFEGNGKIDDVRIYPANSLITSYTYKPLTGITSVTDPGGKTTYYEYDEFNRLKIIKDQDDNIIKTFEYNYQKY